MALSSSPRKLVIPLASGDESRPRTSSLHASKTKRVFYAGVVVEGSENGRRIPDEIQDLVLSLGNAVVIPDESLELRPTTSNQLLNDIDAAAQRKRALQDPGALASVINELVTSERSYVRRLQILKNDYADPLRNFSRSKDTAIIPPYEAKTLFGNIDNLLPVNEAFLTDLEKMIGPNGAQVVGGVGDVCLRHFRELRGFEQYKQFYVKREDAQAIFEKEASKKSSRFSQYIDRIKYQTVENRNRIGLRELLMEPVQRIPRYTLLFRTMLKHMSPEDPQRQKLIEADDIASKIAQAETDEKTRRATIYSCLSAAMEGFPAELFSSERKYIDCIDVEDMVTDAPASSSSNGMMTLHATLFLFEDKLLVAKRMNADKSGYVLAGLDNVEKLAKSGLVPPKGRKHTLSYKGMMDITDVVATDIGGADLNLYLETPPMDVSDRWNGRPFRHFAVIHPPGPINMDPTRTESDKQRFLENLWHTQAVFRARAGQSVVLCSDEQEVENRGHRTTVAKTYYNVYQRTAYLQELKKNKVVVHIDKDRSASADPLPLGEDGDPPFVIIRIHLMDGGLCRYHIRSSDPNDEGEEEIVKTPRVSSRITQTINQFGLFEFKTGRNSMPTTPTARSKVAIFGLDALSRGLFNGRPGSVGDFFAGSINGHKRNRSRSTASRSSMYTQTTQTTTTTATADSMKFSHRSSASTLTAATSISSIEDDVTAFGARPSHSHSNSNGKQSMRTKSRGVSPSDSERGSVSRRSGSTSRPQSRNSAYGGVEGLSDYEDIGDDEYAELQNTQGVRTSDLQLAMQLELARQNSLQHGNNRMVPMQLEAPSQETIYEETSPFSQRNGDRRSIVCRSEYSTTSTVESPPATARPMSIHSTTDHGRPMSVHSTSERRPHGPRSPSPLPPPRGLHAQDSQDSSAWEDEEVVASSSSSKPPVTPGIRRSIRQPLFHANHDATPKGRPSGIPVATPIEPLSIKKKTSLRSSTMMNTSPTPVSRKAAPRGSPLSKSLNRVVSPRRVSPTFVRKSKLASSTGSGSTPSASLVRQSEELEYLRSLAVATKEDIESSRQTIKRIKTQTENLKSAAQNQGDDDRSRSNSPEKFPRSSTPQPVFQPPLTKAAQERLEEMRNLIGRRQVEGVVARSRPRSGTLDTPTRNNALATPETNNFVRAVEGFIAQIEKDLTSAESNANTLGVELARYSERPTDHEVDFERVKQELASSRRAYELVKLLLEDCNAEKEIMYTLFIEAFNDELEQLYNDINFPNHEDALRAVSKDLESTMYQRQELRKENAKLRQKVAMADLRNQELVELLSKHGIPVPEEDYSDE